MGEPDRGKTKTQMKTKRSKRETTTAPIETPSTNIGLTRPEFIRLPKTGLLCPHTGLTRSAVNELVLPNERNGFKPPVRSFCLRQRGAKTGIRLVDYASLRAYIVAHTEECAAA
jgi:hypothetical protein